MKSPIRFAARLDALAVLVAELMDAFSDVVEVLATGGRGEVVLVVAEVFESEAKFDCVLEEDGADAIHELDFEISGTAFSSLDPLESPLSPIILIFFPLVELTL